MTYENDTTFTQEKITRFHYWVMKPKSRQIS
jgi:hypothetical protein